MHRVRRVQGYCDEAFTSVREVFQENFSKHGEVGAAVSVFVGGKKVVDLWGGLANLETQSAWSEETQTMVFSVTKGLTSMVLLKLHQEGRLDYDQRVAHYWPEFAQNGKEAITVRQLVNHRSGLCAIDQPLTLEDVLTWDPLVQALEVQVPEWAPDADQGYGAVAMGAYVGELIRRITGRTTGELLREQLCGPLGVDTSIGVSPDSTRPLSTIYPVSKQQLITAVLPRLLVGTSTDAQLYRQVIRRNSLTHRSVNNPASLGVKGIRNFNRKEVQRAELPWVNGFTTARGLASLYSAMAMGGQMDGTRVFEESVLKPLEERQSWSDRDHVVRKPLGFAQGFVKDLPTLFSPNPEMYGHPGAGGSVGFADPAAGVGMSYVMNKMDYRIRPPRCIRLCHAVYDCLGAHR